MAQLAVQLDPKNSAYLDTIGWVYFKLGDYENAESDVRRLFSKESTPTVRLQPWRNTLATYMPK